MILVKIPNTEILLRQKEACPPWAPFRRGPCTGYISASDSFHLQRILKFSCPTLHTGRPTGCITALLFFIKREAFSKSNVVAGF